MKPIILSFPHSGEEIPSEAVWLHKKPQLVLLCDVDRFVNDLYLSSSFKADCYVVETKYHRYAIDLNRWGSHISLRTVKDCQSLLKEYSSDSLPKQNFVSGLYWEKTTKKEPLLTEPLTIETHKTLLEKYYKPFHNQIAFYQKRILENHKEAYHLDLHSMPSIGTGAHIDKGRRRPEIVVSDCEGRASGADFVKLVIDVYAESGFEVEYNWPYTGGAIIQKHGNPDRLCHSLQIELRRDLYMDEDTKEPLSHYTKIQRRLQDCLESIMKEF